MGKCRWCGKKGFWVFVGKQGMCSKCTMKVGKEIQQRLKIVSEAKATMDQATDAKTKLEQSEMIIEQLAQLLPFEQKKLVSPGTFSELLEITKQTQAQITSAKPN